MDKNHYISSGILELYVAGALSEKENAEVYALLQKYPELLQEVLEIEGAVVALTAATSHGKTQHLLKSIKTKINNAEHTITPTITLQKQNYNWATYSGWAAALVLGVGLTWMVLQNKNLQSRIEISNTQQSLLEIQIENAKLNLNEANSLISILRDDAITKIDLGGQGHFTATYAKVYWDKDQQRIFLDAEGLPEPPKGKVYQVWSLTLAPLAPTSLGTITNFSDDTNKIFEISNPNKSEAFGITLEPLGGSKTPTMDQLYVLGTVNSTS